MKKIKYLLLFLLLIPNVIYAKDINHLYSKFDDEITLYDTSNASIVLGGNNVNVRNSIDGVGVIMGNNITYNSTASYALLLGNNLNINGNILKDGLIAGNIINTDNTNVFTRDVVIIASKANLSGFFGRDVTIIADEINFKNTNIIGNVYIKASKITILESVSVEGTFKYNDDAKLKKSDESIISSIKTYKKEKYEATLLDTIIQKFRTLISQLFIILLIIFITPSLFEKIENNYSKSDEIVKNIGIGLLSMIIIPIILLILLFSTISFAASSIMGMFYIIFMMLSTIISSYILGSLLAKYIFKKEFSIYLKGFIGVIIYDLIILIPYIGGIFTFIFVLYGFGTLINLVFKRKDNKKVVTQINTMKEIKSESKTKVKKSTTKTKPKTKK